MSQDFRQRYEQLHASDPTKPENVSESARISPQSRSLCLRWPDGRRMFFNYSYLVSGEFSGAGKANVVTLNFSLYVVVVEGYLLEDLFDSLLKNSVQQIEAIDERYIDNKFNIPTIVGMKIIDKQIS